LTLDIERLVKRVAATFHVLLLSWVAPARRNPKLPRFQSLSPSTTAC